MTSIFVGAYWPVIGMGVALEVGKLAAVAWLGHQRSTGLWGLKVALAALVAVLMGLNAVGCYGFLAKAHIGHQIEGDVAVAGRAADVDGRIAVQANVVTGLDRRIAQIDKAIETATQRGRAAAAMQLAADQRRNRAELATQRDQANKTLAALKVEKASIEGQAKVADADLGPVRYLATLLGAGDQDVLQRFILVVACLARSRGRALTPSGHPALIPNFGSSTGAEFSELTAAPRLLRNFPAGVSRENALELERKRDGSNQLGTPPIHLECAPIHSSRRCAHVSPVADARRLFQAGASRMSMITSIIPHKADQAREKLSNVGFGAGVVIVLTLLAMLFVTTGVAPTVDPLVFPAP
jgi:hypothetical protein